MQRESPERGQAEPKKRGPPAPSKPPARVALVEMIDKKKEQILLIKNAEGISGGLWNGLGGKIEDGETPFQAVKREVFEESGLKIKSFMYHGTLTIFLGGAVSPSFIIYIFSSQEFTGKMQGDDKNELRWFPLDALPYASMWQDDSIWLPYLLAGRRWVNGTFEFGTDNLLRVAEMMPLGGGEDFSEKVKRSVGIV